MTVPIVAFFNNKGGVGKTSLVYHLAWMYAELGLKIVAADLDPQADLTTAFLDEERLEEIWLDNASINTIFHCVQPLRRGIGDISPPQLEEIDDDLALLIGDLQLSNFEDDLSSEWPGCLDRKERAFRIISAFWRILTQSATIYKADLVLVDLGPNLGAINRAALIAADYVVVPLGPDLFSLQGLKNLGPTLQRWREEWNERTPKKPTSDLRLPKGSMQPIGYIILQQGIRADRPVQAFQRWMVRIPNVYEQAILNPSNDIKEHIETPLAPDPNCLAMLKNYQSLMLMAQEAHKPIFHLKPADGAIGAHMNAVRKVYGDFKTLAHTIASQIDIQL